MTGPLESLAFSKGVPLEPQIAASLRELILNGTLPEGSRLPPSPELAKIWNTNYFTVHKALCRLVDDGLLSRRKREGTTVLSKRDAVKKAAIYANVDICANGEFAFYGQLAGGIRNLLFQRGIESELWLDSRPEGDQRVPLPHIEKAILNGEVQAVFAVVKSMTSGEWLSKLPMVKILYDHTAEGGNVWTDMASFGLLAARSLASQGVRRAGFICNIAKDAKDFEKNFTLRNQDVYASFREEAAKLGLELREEWIVEKKTWREESFERFGYRAFKELWSLKERPDGLAVFPDMALRGVSTAILEAHAEKKIKYAFHRNKGVDLVCPLPAQWIEADPSEIAGGMVAQMDHVLRGEPSPLLRIDYKLLP